MPLSQTEQFERLMTALEDWHCDSVQAAAYDGNTGFHDPGHVIHQRRPYPGPPWRQLWREGHNRPGILEALQDELYGLSHGPSQAQGLHPHTDEWRTAIGQAQGSLRVVARRFGVSHTTVLALRSGNQAPGT